MSQIRILVVDDEPFNLDIISEYLEGAGYLLQMAESGEEAWTYLRRGDSRFDLVVLDRMMPGIDGLELLRWLKADRRLADIPVIMQTAAASPEQVREGLAAGAYYYLTKPFEPESLQSIVRAALDDLHQRRALAERLAAQRHALQTLQHGVFAFRTMEEAHGLAALAASICDEPDVVVLGLSELLVNGVEHGNLAICFDEKSRLREAGEWEAEVKRRLALPENQSKYVRLTVASDPLAWVFSIEDEGGGFVWQDFLELAPERAFAPNGRGIALARQLAFDELEYQGNGNCVRATVRKRRH
ncbi:MULTISPECIES: ATP-binding response regulator [Denitromonas]|uniref:Response regulator n=2 Tax=Denitromonas TaxID=139331 RepID=A0A557RBU2_9RHOO|nr:MULTISPECIES: response regulator [Denitromonas]TVO51981.1 response regulator [Denitromonas halophila]TVO62631.1 response regulator [Denitromonas ohlonensis]TVO78835.1 response regulator [Denitromonas ohlonensis]